MRLALAGLALRIVVLAVILGAEEAQPHDIYTGVHGYNGQLCCGADDCSAVEFRVRPDSVDFLVEDKWVRIPEDRITYARITGDDGVKGHFCGRKILESELRMYANSQNVFDGWYVFCAFVPPGGF